MADCMLDVSLLLIQMEGTSSRNTPKPRFSPIAFPFPNADAAALASAVAWAWAPPPVAVAELQQLMQGGQSGAGSERALGRRMRHTLQHRT